MKFLILAVCMFGALGSVVEGKSVGKHQGIDPADLIVIGGNTYYISPSSHMENVYTATDYCKADGMELVSFYTEQKWLDVQNYLISNTTDGDSSFWNSLKKFGDKWQWIDGSYAEFTAWSPSEPNENKDPVCVRFIASQGWLDQNCDDVVAAFICELINSNPTTTSPATSTLPTSIVPTTPEPSTTELILTTV